MPCLVLYCHASFSCFCYSIDRNTKMFFVQGIDKSFLDCFIHKRCSKSFISRSFVCVVPWLNNSIIL